MVFSFGHVDRASGDRVGEAGSPGGEGLRSASFAVELQAAVVDLLHLRAAWPSVLPSPPTRWGVNRKQRVEGVLVSRRFRVAAGLRGHPPHGIFSHLSPNQVELVDRSFVSAELMRRESDIIYRVGTADREVYIYVLLEFQSTVDKTIPVRMLLYILQLYDLITEERGEELRMFGAWLNGMFGSVLGREQILSITDVKEVRSMLAELAQQIERRGERRGVKREKIETAKRMLAAGMDEATVAQLAGLSAADVARIAGGDEADTPQ